MSMARLSLSTLTAAALLCLAPTLGHAETAEELMNTRLGTTNADPVIVDAVNRAAQPVTPELRAKALECWTNNGCDTGTGGKISVAYADGFGENVWRRVTAMEFIQQALTYPDVGKISYVSARSDASKAISDLRSYIAQGVNVIVIFADHGAALGPTVREAKEAGIKVVLHNGTEIGTPGDDYLTNIAEDICGLGTEFVKAVKEGNPAAKGIMALGGTPGNTLSSTWQDCAEKETANQEGLKILGRADTNWTQEGTFTAVSTALSQFDKIDGYIYEYADGFRGAVRAYKSANAPMDFVAALRTDEQGLFCDWEEANHEGFKLYYSSGQNFQARFALTAAMMSLEGKEIPTRISVPFKMKQAVKGLCNKALPMEMSVSTMVDSDTLKGMFAK